jgi:hypothetical protein
MKSKVTFVSLNKKTMTQIFYSFMLESLCLTLIELFYQHETDATMNLISVFQNKKPWYSQYSFYNPMNNPKVSCFVIDYAS